MSFSVSLRTVIYFCFVVVYMPLFGQKKNKSQLFNRLTNGIPLSDLEIQHKLDSIPFFTDKEQALLYCYLGDHYQYRNATPKAIRYYYQAIESLKSIQADETTSYLNGIAYASLGAIYGKNYRSKIAFSFFHKAIQLNLKEKRGELFLIPIYTNISSLHYKLDHKDSSLIYIERAIALAHKRKLNIINSYAHLISNFPKHDSVPKYISYIKNTSNQKGLDALSLYTIRNSLIRNYFENKEYAKVDSVISLNMASFRKEQLDSIVYYNTKLNRGYLLLHDQKIKAATDNILPVIAYYKRQKLFRYITPVYDTLQNAYQREGNYKLAYQMHQSNLKNDSIIASYTASKQQEAQLIYDTLLEEKQSDFLSKNKQTRVYIALIIIACGFMIGLFLFQRKYKKQQHIEFNLISKKITAVTSQLKAIKDESLLTHQGLLLKTILLNEKQLFISELIKEFNVLCEGATSEEELKLYKSLEKQASANLKGIPSDKFEYHFEKIYPNFFQNLQNISEDLSIKEARIAALIKLNFDTKEIAEINKQESTTVNAVKSRLKQKLNLSKENSLYHYIQSI